MPIVFAKHELLECTTPWRRYHDLSVPAVYRKAQINERWSFCHGGEETYSSLFVFMNFTCLPIEKNNVLQRRFQHIFIKIA